MDNREVLLRVENLCQYFKMGKKQLKAVDDVSFDVYRGEVKQQQVDLLLNCII